MTGVRKVVVRKMRSGPSPLRHGVAEAIERQLPPLEEAKFVLIQPSHPPEDDAEVYPQVATECPQAVRACFKSLNLS